jgi:hypothetical protein
MKYFYWVQEIGFLFPIVSYYLHVVSSTILCVDYRQE